MSHCRRHHSCIVAMSVSTIVASNLFACETPSDSSIDRDEFGDVEVQKAVEDQPAPVPLADRLVSGRQQTLSEFVQSLNDEEPLEVELFVRVQHEPWPYTEAFEMESLDGGPTRVGGKNATKQEIDKYVQRMEAYTQRASIGYS